MNFPWQKQDADLQRELAHHLAELTDEFVRRGHPLAEARILAKKEFGGPTQITELCRDESRWSWLQSFVQDLHFGWRMMWKTPAVTLAAVLSLALGIGANTAIVSLMHTVLWRSLPVPAPEQLSLVFWQSKGRDHGLFRMSSGSMYRSEDKVSHVADFFGHQSYLSMRSALQGKANLASYQHSDDVSIVFAGRPTVAKQRPVSGNFFEVMGQRPVHGRLIADSDDQASAAPTVVLTHRFWKSFLSADPAAVGKTLRINNRPYAILGVLPASFYGLIPGDDTDLYSPTVHGAWLAQEHGPLSPLVNADYWWTKVIARRASGVSPEQLESLLQTVFQKSWSKQPKNLATAPRIKVEDGSSGLGNFRRNYRQSLYVLAGLVLLVLAIACANIANLLLARATARAKEVALRISLGCARARLMRQFLTESALLAALGGLASIAVAYLSSNLLATFLADRRSRAAFEIGIDLPMIFAAIGFTLFTLLLFGLFPAWRSANLDTSAALKEGSGSLGAAARHWYTPGKLLIVGQMAFSIVLVAAAVLFVRNLQSIENLDPGFDRRNLVIFSVRPGTSGYAKERLAAFYANLERSLAQTPGVESVGLAMVRPLDGGGWWDEVKLPGNAKPFPIAGNFITPGYIPTQTSRPFVGRNFSREDSAPLSAKVVVLSEDLARLLDPHNSLLGRKVQIGDYIAEVVGIAPAIAYNSLTQRPQVLWMPFDPANRETNVLLRTKAKPSAVLPAIRETMRGLDPNLPLVDLITMEDQIAKGLQRERMFATLCGAFGALALVLSAIGLYGVISYNASRRRNEIGVRLALGAMPADVVRMVVREGLALTFTGLLLGAPVIWYGAKFVENEVAGKQPLDPASLSVSALVLAAAASLAAWLPARRASRLDPASALRQE